ncbi:hypothetical protein [Natrononativus amylolyticus]|uniref:hypothetical protein n=1 Tax=Natrononativus amylolyticus TaxID=2963434 RepID=UPI0020CBC2D0|nr:hypothetical protein [Natrononativus amylolyticus]
MSRLTDGLLAMLVLGLFAGAFLVVGAPFSLAWFLLGALGTIAFEIAAFRHSEVVYRYWDRPSVQAGTVVLAVGLVVIGVLVAPSRLLSAGIGSLMVYLAVLGLVVAGVLSSGR